LIRWLDLHPTPSDPEAFLWLSESRSRLYQPLGHAGAQKMVAQVFQRAGLVHKKHNLHWFRHSRASILHPHMSATNLCEYFGWELGSDQLKTYVHADLSQVQEAISRMRGLTKTEEAHVARQCFACNLVNAEGLRFCGRCGKPLTTEAAIEEKDALKEAFRLMRELARNPEKMAAFETWKTERGGGS